MHAISSCFARIFYTPYLKNGTDLIVNNFYTLEPTLIILAPYMLKLLPSRSMYNLQPHLSYVATLPEKALTKK